MDTTVTEMFESIQKTIDEDQELREKIRRDVKELDQVARKILKILQNIHQPEYYGKNTVLINEAKPNFAEAKELYRAIESYIPRQDYYKYNDHWRFATQRLAFLAMMIEFLESLTLAPLSTVAEIIGLRSDREEGFPLEVEDYLQGTLLLSSELSRLATNSIMNRDFSFPPKVASFLSSLSAGFHLLNLKNDGLRRRYDGLKWDVKKVEEIMYDLSLRQLIPPPCNQSEDQKVD